MLVTLSGIVTLVKLVHGENASFPMLVTGRLLIWLGMVTVLPEPVYPMMVIVPLLVVYVNWACIAAGSASNRSSGSSLVAQPVLKPRATVFGQVVWARTFFVFTSFLAEVCLGYVFY